MKQLLFFVYFLFVSAEIHAQQPRLVFPTWHGNEVTNAQFSPDQKLILTVSYDRQVKIWSAYNGKLLQTLQVHQEEIITACFSPDSKRILTSSKDSTAKLWDIASSSLLQTFHGLPGSKSFAIFSPDGKYILTNSQQQFAILWDTFSGKQKQVLLYDGQTLSETAKFSGDGKFILITFEGGTCVWETSSQKEVQTLKIDGYQGLSDISSDGRLIITQLSSNYTQYIVWESATGNIQHRLDAGKGTRYPCLSFSPDNKTVMAVTNDTILTIWNLVSGKVLHKLSGFKNNIKSAAFSPDGQRVIAGGRNRVAKVWELSTGKLMNELLVNSGNIVKATFSPDGKKILLADVFEPSTIWNTKNGNNLFTLSGNTTVVTDAFLSPGGEHFYSNSYNTGWQKLETTSARQAPLSFNRTANFLGYSKDGTWLMYTDSLLHLVDPLSGITQYSFTWDINPKNYHFNKGGQWINLSQAGKDELSIGNFKKRFSLAGAANETITVSTTDIPNKKLLRFAGKELVDVWDISQFAFRINGKRHYFTDFVPIFSPDDKLLLTTSNEEEIILWDAITGNYIKTLTGHITWPVYHADFSLDGKKAVSGGHDRNIIVWDIAKGASFYKLKGHLDGVRSTYFSKDGSRIISSSNDGHIKLWDAEKRKELYSCLIIDSINFFQQIPLGYYQTTSVAAKFLHYVTKDLKVITFEQLDVKYNRPDKVLEAIGNTDTALINGYRRAWEKRIKKLGIDTTQFRDGYSVPEADFENRDAIEYEQKKGTLKLHIKGIDSTYKLDRFNIWVNESPLYGQRGVSVSRKNRNNLDTTITIGLSQGENRIETSITNVNGTESYRMPLYVKYTPATPKKQTIHYIGIGIDQFSDNNYNLQYSTKDIKDFAINLKKKYGEKVVIDTLLNSSVTKEKVKALKQKLLLSSIDDKVIVSYSGHGVLNKSYDYFLSTYKINFEKPEEYGLPYEELESLLDSIPARKKLLLIDACHSGEVDKEDIKLIESTAKINGIKKGFDPDEEKSNKVLGLQNSFELMQNLFVNVGKGTGATIISAAAGTQFALERNDLKNGVFTYCLLEALNKKSSIKISELKKTVGERVTELTKGAQKPTSRSEIIASDWEL